MAKKQTRRSISVNRNKFDQAKKAAAAAGVSLSKFTEDALDAVIGANADAQVEARAS